MRESISTQIVFLAKLFARIIDSYALIGNGTERPHAPFTQFPPIVTSCITTVQHHHQETVLGSIHGWWSPRLTCDLIVFVSPFFPGKIPRGPSPQHPFCYCFTPSPIRSSDLQPWQPLSPAWHCIFQPAFCLPSLGIAHSPCLASGVWLLPPQTFKPQHCPRPPASWAPETH